MTHRLSLAALVATILLFGGACSSDAGTEDAATVGALDPTTTETSVASTPAVGSCSADDPRFETGVWEGTGSFRSEISSGGEVRATTLTPGDFTFTVTVDDDGNVTEGSWSVTGMSVAVSAGDRNDTATYLGQGPVTGNGDRLLMGGNFAVSVAGVAPFDVPIIDYPILPDTCVDGKIVGSIEEPGSQAAAAAGIEGGFEAPFTAEMTG